jgi:hypothetical protein
MTTPGTRDAGLTTGEFGRRCGLSHKALRLYDMSGLLPPAHVDPLTGHRRYAAGQLDRRRAARGVLRRLGGHRRHRPVLPRRPAHRRDHPMTDLPDYSRQSRFSDPGRHAALLDPLPTAIGPLGAVVRNVLVHYRATDEPLSPAHLDEIDSRWVERILDADRSRFDIPLASPRPEGRRVAGCCRDFTLLTVAALRRHGVPARSRIGFADYFHESYHHDHVVTEFWDGDRWVVADSQLEPTPGGRFDVSDMPALTGGGATIGDPFVSAARVWTAYRRGEVDVDRYGVGPGLPFAGAWFVRNYVLNELAHRMRDELLLWDVWGLASLELGDELALIDGIAALLLAADAGDTAADRELAARYAADDRLHPSRRIACHSPTGALRAADLTTRAVTTTGTTPTPLITHTA